MKNFDRRRVLRLLGLGCAAMPVLAAKEPFLQGAARAADPEVESLLREAARHALRIKNNAASGQSWPQPGDLYVAAGHLRLFDAMAETRGWKGMLREARLPGAAEVDRTARDGCVALADRLTAAGLPISGQELETLYWRYRNRISEPVEARMHQSLRSGTFLADAAGFLDAAAGLLKNHGYDAKPAGSIGKPGRNRAGGVVLLVAGSPDEFISCEGLQGMSGLFTLTAIGFLLIPPLEPLALIYEIGALICDVAAFFVCMW